MATKKYYCQCRMRKQIGNDRYYVNTVWIPAKFARLGNFVKLKNNNGWEVIEVYSESTQEVSKIEAMSRDYLKQRSVSDI